MEQVLLVVGDVTEKQVKKARKHILQRHVEVTRISSERLFASSTQDLKALRNVKYVVMDELTSGEWPGPDAVKDTIAGWRARCWIAYQNGNLTDFN
jgi:hypothetical protein